jgi:excisionase family DNA binding protein
MRDDGTGGADLVATLLAADVRVDGVRRQRRRSLRLAATSAPKTRQPPSVAPTPADLQVLWGGRDGLLKVAELAEHLGVSNATVYGLCEPGELPYVWLVNSIRIRPRDLEEFVASRPTVAENRRPHRRKEPAE